MREKVGERTAASEAKLRLLSVASVSPRIKTIESIHIIYASHVNDAFSEAFQKSRAENE